MSTLDATVSMLEAMPEDARIKVMEFTQNLSIGRNTFPTDPNHKRRLSHEQFRRNRIHARSNPFRPCRITPADFRWKRARYGGRADKDGKTAWIHLM